MTNEIGDVQGRCCISASHSLLLTERLAASDSHLQGLRLLDISSRVRKGKKEDSQVRRYFTCTSSSSSTLFSTLVHGSGQLIPRPPPSPRQLVQIFNESPSVTSLAQVHPVCTLTHSACTSTTTCHPINAHQSDVTRPCPERFPRLLQSPCLPIHEVAQGAYSVSAAKKPPIDRSLTTTSGRT